MAQRIQARRGTAAAATAANPVLASGEFGFETDTGKVKIGDGVTAWNSLAYIGGGGDLATHLADSSDAHDASAISFTPTGGIAAVDVQAALVELDTEKAASGHTHTAPTAASVTYAGSTNLSATNVEAALDELDAEKQSKGESAKAQRSLTNQAIPTGTSTDIVFDTEVLDDSTMIDLTTSATRVYARKSGFALAVASCRFDQAATTSRRILAITKNGVQVAPLELPNTPNGTTPISVPWAGPVVAGDYFTALVYHTHGSNLNLNAGPENSLSLRVF